MGSFPLLFDFSKLGEGNGTETISINLKSVKERRDGGRLERWKWRTDTVKTSNVANASSKPAAVIIKLIWKQNIWLSISKVPKSGASWFLCVALDRVVFFVAVAYAQRRRAEPDDTLKEKMVMIMKSSEQMIHSILSHFFSFCSSSSSFLTSFPSRPCYVVPISTSLIRSALRSPPGASAFLITRVN